MNKNLIGIWYWLGLPGLYLAGHFQLRPDIAFALAWVVMFLIYDFFYHRERKRIQPLLKEPNPNTTPTDTLSVD